MTYNDAFYDMINEGSRRSARAVVPVLVDLLQPTSVVDFGCGEGVWLDVFREHVEQIHGIDGAIDPTRLQIPPECFTACDLATETPDLGRTFDLALSLEVAEHLPPKRASAFVDLLIAHAKMVVFSAAIPGQGGVGHVNEQHVGYWVELFEQRGYRVSGGLRWKFWDQVPDPVEVWYAQNMLLCVDQAEVDRRWTTFFEIYDGWDGPAGKPFSVVHPFLWDSRR